MLMTTPAYAGPDMDAAAPATGPAAADEFVMLREDDVPEEQNEKRQHYAVHESGGAKALAADLQDWVYQMCEEYGISGHEPLILSMLYQESGYNPGLVHHGNYGMAQINQCNHNRLRRDLGISNFLDAHQSIRAGVFMMAEALRANGYNESMALSAYFTGRNGIPSTNYSNQVLSIKSSMAAI